MVTRTTSTHRRGGFRLQLEVPPPTAAASSSGPPGCPPHVDCSYQETWNEVPIMESPSLSVGGVNIIINPELQRRCLRSPVAKTRLPSRGEQVSNQSTGHQSCGARLHMRERQASLVAPQPAKCRAAQTNDSETRTHEFSNCNELVTLDLQPQGQSQGAQRALTFEFGGQTELVKKHKLQPLSPQCCGMRQVVAIFR